MVAVSCERWQRTGSEEEFGVFVYEDATLRVKDVPGFGENGYLDRRHEMHAVLQIGESAPVICECRSAFALKMEELGLPLYLDS